MEHCKIFSRQGGGEGGVLIRSNDSTVASETADPLSIIYIT